MIYQSLSCYANQLDAGCLPDEIKFDIHPGFWDFNVAELLRITRDNLTEKTKRSYQVIRSEWAGFCNETRDEMENLP